MLRKLPGCLAIGLLDQLRSRKLAGSVNGYKEIELALLGPDLGDINVETADWLERVAFIRIHATRSKPLKMHVRGAQNRSPLLRDML